MSLLYLYQPDEHQLGCWNENGAERNGTERNKTKQNMLVRSMLVRIVHQYRLSVRQAVSQSGRQSVLWLRVPGAFGRLRHTATTTTTTNTTSGSD